MLNTNNTLTCHAICKDGGSKIFVKKLNFIKTILEKKKLSREYEEYWQDFRIGSKTKGMLFKGKYGDESSPAKGKFYLKITTSSKMSVKNKELTEIIEQ